MAFTKAAAPATPAASTEAGNVSPVVIGEGVSRPTTPKSQGKTLEVCEREIHDLIKAAKHKFGGKPNQATVAQEIVRGASFEALALLAKGKWGREAASAAEAHAGRLGIGDLSKYMPKSANATAVGGGRHHDGGDGGGNQHNDPKPPPVPSATPAGPVAEATPTRRIDEIQIGQRFRKDMGDIPALAAKITELGLLQPPVVDPNGKLVCGERRILAARHLGWTEIPVHVVDIDAVVRGEFAENTCRKDFTPSELVAIGREVERVERERAKVRKAHDGRPGKLPERAEGRLPRQGCCATRHGRAQL
jgi:hypothetical protein